MSRQLPTLFPQMYDISVARVDLRIPRWPEALSGLTIAQLSDLHLRDQASAAQVRRSIEIANGLEPDLILLTGDYVADSAEDAAECAELLAQLRSRDGTFAVLGNHETWTDADHVGNQLSTVGINVLRDDSVALKLGEERLWVLGIEDTGYTGYNMAWHRSIGSFRNRWKPKTDALSDVIRRIPDSEPRLLMVHNPDFTEMLPEGRIDLTLCGHTHGGQLRLPVIGAPILPSCHGQKFVGGLVRRNESSWTYVNRGIGLWPIRVRINCPSEITLFRLRAL